jgi:transposase
MEQRENTKFYFKLGKKPTEIYEMLRTVCGDEGLSRSSGFDWFKRYKNRREDLQDDPRRGRPSTS